ncbi:MAG: sulfate adenylyltransferase [Gammaproteobacteria bacterium]|nr:sulfate adenylyltransferase [Gammaproteobacteria bacterium]NIM72016.1 sulfate adenylyltransferase [Gammaproteobacteria bacterium]NIN38424.1 sulfate adenylyltransferase [Gammaproteobacteria bacterium]NIO23743.1 sulfate adenylyltransferase [Gammaproteobacteria bacterium]NIO64385.1 sulfate adenylyltransferase [Gammaproteobacteria bacterium]
MSTLVSPHGSATLRPLLLSSTTERDAESARAETLPAVQMSSREAGDVVMMGIGGFTPLGGFMGYDDWRGVCDDMRMSNGVFWPIPITLSVDSETAKSIHEGSDVALMDPETGKPLATMTVAEKYGIDKEHECRTVFKTTDLDHPGVRMVMEQGDVNLAGELRVISTSYFGTEFGRLFLSPAETRAMFEERGWSKVAAFQTRNPMHRSHEYLAKIGIEVGDGVLIHSLLGRLKPGDIPAGVRARAIDALIENYFVENTVIHAGYPLDMRYAGPREALLHALFRQNYGCSEQLIGRDHAGVGDYYGPFDAHHIFDEIPEDALEIRPLKIDWTFWCYRCDGMASMRTCKCGAEHRLLLSGTKLRKMLSEGEEVPDKFSRPEVLAILREYYEGLSEEDNVKVDLKGHSAA